MCGQDFRCDRLRWRWCSAHLKQPACYLLRWSVSVPWAVSSRCPWPVDLDGGACVGGRVGEGSQGECVWAGWQVFLSGLRSQVSTPPSLHPLSHPSMRFSNTDTPTHSLPPLTQAHSAEAGLHVILMPSSPWQGCWPVLWSDSFIGFSDERGWK